MSENTFKAGRPLTFMVDLANVPNFTGVQFELYKTDSLRTVVIGKYPLANGFKEVTKIGTEYSIALDAEDTFNLLGDYSWELTFYDADENIIDISEDVDNSELLSGEFKNIIFTPQAR